jgi:glycosyltransferase involved in cell wall biosynthesis
VTRLLQAMAGAKFGGAELFFERLAIALQQAGQSQHLVIRDHEERTTRLRAAGLTVDNLPFGGLFDFVTSRRLESNIAVYQPDIVLTWMSRATFACKAPVTARKFVHAARLGGYYDLKYYRHCDHLIANTRDIAAYIVRESWPANRVHFLPNFVPDMNDRAVARSSLNTPPDVPLVLALGRLHRNKAFDALLAALAEVPGTHLWIAGEGELRHVLERDAGRLGITKRVRFLGWREDNAALLAAADILVCPSRVEPLGNVILEAWAARRAVIATDSQGPKQLLTDHETGLLVPVDDTSALAFAIRKLGEDLELRTKLANAGRQAYEAEYGERRVLGLYRDFLGSLAH